jgi:uncharacterized protein YndB with AHSA1/START domain
MMDAGRDPREGVLEQAGSRWRLRFERVLSHPPEKVWRALTEEEHLSAWFPTTIEGELRPGAPLTFRFRGEEMPPTSGECIECEPPRVLELTWGFSEEDEQQPEQSRFELTPEGDGCRLTFMTTYDRVGKSARDAAGWHVCFDALERHLAGAPPTGDAQPWASFEKLYAARFGPEAATIGPPASMKRE